MHVPLSTLARGKVTTRHSTRSGGVFSKNEKLNRIIQYRVSGVKFSYFIEEIVDRTVMCL